MKPRNYLLTLLNTLTSPQFYVSVLNQPLSFTWRFFFMSYLILSIFATGLFVVIDLPQWQTKLHALSTELAQNYPENLQFHWDKQTLSTQPAQPVSVPYPTDLPKGELPDTALYINTQAKTVPEALTSVQSAPLIVVTQNTLFVSDLSGKWSDMQLSELPGFEEPFTLTKQNLPQYISAGQKLATQVFSFLKFSYPLFFFIVNSFAAIVSTLFSSIVIFFFVQLWRRPFPFRKIFQLSLHAAVAAEIVSLLTQRFVNIADLNMYTISFWAYMLVILFTMRGVKQLSIVQKKN